MHKLSNRGFSHLLVPVLAFLLVAGLGGAYFLAKSHAAAPTTSTNPSTTQTTTTTDATSGTDASTVAAVPDDSTASNPCPGVYFSWSWNTPTWKWEEKMTKDPSAVCVARSSLKCTDGYGNYFWFHGGWVHPVGKYSGVNCSSPFNKAVQGNIDWSSDGGTHYVYMKAHTF